MSTKEHQEIRDKFIEKDEEGIKDWSRESVTIPVEMTIGGIPVNPKEFFKRWESQMEQMISDKATELLSEKIGSQKMLKLASRIYDLENILKEFEKEVTWEVENPFKEPKEVQDGCSKI